MVAAKPSLFSFFLDLVGKTFPGCRPGIFPSLEELLHLMLFPFHYPSFVFVLLLHCVWLNKFLPLCRSWLIGKQAFGRDWGSTLRNWACLWIPTNSSISFSLQVRVRYIFLPTAVHRVLAETTRLLTATLGCPSRTWLTPLTVSRPLFSWHFWNITCHLVYLITYNYLKK